MLRDKIKGLQYVCVCVCVCLLLKHVHDTILFNEVGVFMSKEI